jgi:VIT1/CCC1 family predicted Fe2+/Mn2+ transporter
MSGAARSEQHANAAEPRSSNDIDQHRADPRPPAVTFATTEHFTLQGARASTIAGSTGRATMFLSAVSGGLVALGLIATASRVGTAFYAFGLVALPTLAFIGLVTFERVLQSGIEDGGYAWRIARLRGYYFDQAPELAPYLLSVPPEQRLQVQGITGGRWQAYRTVAGMVAVITAVLAGSALGLLAAVASHHSLAAAIATGGIVAVAAVSVLTRYQRSAWCRAACALLAADEQAQPPTDVGKKRSTRRRVAGQRPRT